MFFRDVIVNLVEILVHKFPLRIWFEPQIATDFHRLKKQNSYPCFIRVNLWRRCQAAGAAKESSTSPLMRLIHDVFAVLRLMAPFVAIVRLLIASVFAGATIALIYA